MSTSYALLMLISMFACIF